MSHLGGRVSALVDGRLSVDATERALVHLASCAACRRDVAAERAVRRMLADDEPTAPDGLTSSLLALGGQHGPLSQRYPVLPPGSGDAQPAPWPESWPESWPAPGPAGGPPWDGAGGRGDPAPWPGGTAAPGGGAGPRHAVRLPAGRRARVAAGGSFAVLATGALGVGLLGAPVATPTAATSPAPAAASATSPNAGATTAARTGRDAGTRAVVAGRSTAPPAAPLASVTVGDGVWDHVVRGTRVLCVLVTGS